MKSPCLFGVRALLLLVIYLWLPPNAARAENEKQGLIIVAPGNFQDALKTFVRERKRERPTELVRLETVLKSERGADDAEKLKRFLYRRWKETKAGYVLLVGDADVLPVRYMALDRITAAAFDYAFYPSDLYYSDLVRKDGSFDDWNAHRDGFHAGYYGEVRGEKNKGDRINFDAVDYRPDIAVGRWPVSTPGEVKNVSEKTLAYERGLGKRAQKGQAGAALFAVGGWVDMRPQMAGYGAVLGRHWTVSRFFFSDASRNDATPPPDRNQLVTALNSGVSLLLHAGHGYDNGWEQCLDVRDLSAVQNADRLPVVVSAGCSTARFSTLPPYEAYTDVNGNDHKGTDAGETFAAPPPPPACYQKGAFNRTGLGERLLRGGANGAVAYIGCNTGSQPCSLTLLDGFTRSAIGPDPRLGDCWSAAICHYYDAQKLEDLSPTPDWYPASIFFQGMKFMVFGDPTLPLR